MAAHLEGKSIAALDMIGLAQKGGAVLSFLKIAPTQDEIGAPRIAAGAARLVLGCDIVVAAGTHAIPAMRKGVTAAVVNLEGPTTGDFTRVPDLDLPADKLRQAIVDATGPGLASFVDAGRLARALMGAAIGANLFLVGFAWQRGFLPLSREAIERAIELNGVAVAFNRRAFLWGRRAAHDPAAVEALGRAADPERPRTRTLDELVEHRATFLADYQDRAYAERYRRAVAAVREAEQRVLPGRTDLAEAGAQRLFKPMAHTEQET